MNDPIPTRAPVHVRDRYAIANYIENELDPVRDHEEIVYLVGAYEYPWLLRKSLEFALFRTYGVPHTSRILQATGQFASHGQQRYDDTTLMLAGIAEHGYDSEYGQAAIANMNRLHGRYNIRNEDMLYVLSTFVFEPIRWHDQFGWRKPTQKERLANFIFWREIGKRMGIRDIPEDIDAYEAFNVAHEAEYFRYDPANHAIGEATVRIFLNWYPRPLWPLIREVIYSFLDDRLLAAFGFPKPHGIIRWGVRSGLRLLAAILRRMPPREKPFHYTEVPTRTYGAHFDVRQLGPRDVPAQAGD